MKTTQLVRWVQRGLVTDWIRVLPDLVRLAYRIVRDPRVPAPVRAGVGALAAYVVVPVGVIPDWIPVAGRIDDIVVVVVGLRALLRRVPDEVLVEHWDRNVDILEKLIGRDLIVPEALRDEA